MIKLKYKKETEKELKHEDIFHNEEFLGYVIKDHPLVGLVWKWHFVSKCKLPNLAGRTKKELLQLIENEIQ
jgi:hypothetical protein